jgi:hypothetical protein
MQGFDQMAAEMEATAYNLTPRGTDRHPTTCT